MGSDLNNTRFRMVQEPGYWRCDISPFKTFSANGITENNNRIVADIPEAEILITGRGGLPSARIVTRDTEDDMDSIRARMEVLARRQGFLGQVALVRMGATRVG